MRKLFTAVSLAIVIILGAAVPTSAQGDSAIHGIVKARADGSALPGAVVELQGDALSSAMTTTTTAEGQFAFPRLVPGDYMLTVTLASFQDERYRLSLKPREVQTLELDVGLAAGSGIRAGRSERDSVCFLSGIDASHRRTAG